MSVNERRSEPAARAGCLGVFVRIFWLAAGNALLFFLAVFIAQGHAPLVTDVLFWAVAGLLVAARYVDVTRLNGLTAEGAPASLRDWHRYSMFLLGSAALLWSLARAASWRLG